MGAGGLSFRGGGAGVGSGFFQIERNSKLLAGGGDSPRPVHRPPSRENPEKATRNIM